MSSYLKVPKKLTNGDVLKLVNSPKVNIQYIVYFKKFSGLSDQRIADALSLNVKTIQNYRHRKSPVSFRQNTKEHLLRLTALYKHGIGYFGSKEKFNAWLDKDNYYFDWNKPASYMPTIAGIEFIDSNLYALEYGDVA